MYKRISNLRKSFDSNGISAYLVTNPTNIRYLTDNFISSDSWLLVTKKKSYYITDSRYTEEVKAALKGISVVQWEGSMGRTAFELAISAHVCTFGYDEAHFSLAAFKRLKKTKPKTVKLIAANGLVEQLREIKDESEVKLIKKALKLHKECLIYIKKYIKAGVSEDAILQALQRFILKHRVGFSFDPICAAGVSSSYPHALVSRRKIRKNDVFLLDMGIDVNGYKSDLTRMFLLGKIPTLMREVYDAVQEAQQRAIRAIKPGVTMGEVDDQARNYLKDLGLSQYFGHGLGHGVGLDIHESPRLGPRGKQELKPGMVVTVEPGVYLPRQFGVRLEEMVLVTEQGSKVLSAHCH